MLASLDTQSNNLEAPPGGSAARLDDAWWRHCLEVAVQLYPHGPTEQHIWSRADGDIATVNLQGHGKAAWFAALSTLRQGGGGRLITARQLIETMRQDSPNNIALEQLANVLTYRIDCSPACCVMETLVRHLVQWDGWRRNTSL
ncbi:MAG TPA: effector-associated domain EAD1-containing protein [Candidatus Tectomicrobia bacterium]|jgi:hypothetical protein